MQMSFWKTWPEEGVLKNLINTPSILIMTPTRPPVQPARFNPPGSTHPVTRHPPGDAIKNSNAILTSFTLFNWINTSKSQLSWS